MEAPAIIGLTKSVAQPNIRMGLQGMPNSGKTTACTSFPNVIFIDIDHKMPPGFDCIPMWDPTFVESLIKRPTPHAMLNRRDAIKKWLRENIMKFSKDQTLVIDSWTMLMNEFDMFGDYDKTPYMTKGNEYDGFKFHKHKIIYSLEILSFLKSAVCNIIVTFHEQVDRNDKGQLTGKFRPLMSGQMADQIEGHFTCWFRQHIDKGPKWLWQVRSNEFFNAVYPTNFIMPESGTLPANYSALTEHLR